jgi:hypothetical protein
MASYQQERRSDHIRVRVTAYHTTAAAQVSIHQLLPEIARMPTGGVCSHVNRKCEEKKKKKQEKRATHVRDIHYQKRRKRCMRRNAMLTS